jgi:hypothetical protein
MGQSGSVRSISLDGISFSPPIDQEIIYNTGGTVAKESTTYGDGRTRGQFVVDPGMISGCIVDLEDDDKFEKLQEFAAKDSVDVSFTTIDGTSYGGAGQIIADNGITRNSKTNNSNDEFSVVAKNGKFTKL